MSATASCKPVGFSGIAPLLVHIASAVITRLLTYPFRTARSTVLYNDVLNAAVRCMLGRITIPQARYLNPSTSARYSAYCKQQNVEPAMLEVEGRDGTIAAHWIGRRDADTVVLYLHGGGYTQSAGEGYFHYLERLVKDINKEQGREQVAALVLAYSLAPEATYPTQLRETATVLSHIITKFGRSPSSILISADSAGGNLALSLLSHLLHPHPDVPIITLNKPLGGVLLYSPWAGFRTDYPSFDNEALDMLSPLGLRKYSGMFLNKADPTNLEADPGPVSGDAWTEPCLNPASWWNDLHELVGDVFVAYGSYEVLADCIRELEKNMKKGWVEGGGNVNRIAFLEASKEAHIAPIVDFMTPGKKDKKSDTQVAIEMWYNARLQNLRHRPAHLLG